uniref:P-loop ATPase, Sll1717 family n=1 Tax=Methylophaga lonarensis TaxID=999151 RepID=UPI003D2A00AE
KQTLSKENLLSSIQNHLLDERSVFIILFDDTDQVASPDDPQHLNRIWGLMLAIRKLTSKSPNIKCIISLRMEVWMRLLRNEKGQRDQIDHFRPLVMFQRAPEHLIKSIFNKRISQAALESGYRGSQPLSHFFEDTWMQIPTSNERRSWDQFLLKSSRERPRDMVQLVNHLAKSAKERDSEKIGDVDAEKGMEYFSRERAEDLGIEMGYDCPQFLDVIRSFVDLDFESNFEDLRDHLKLMPSRFSVKIGGKALKPSNDEDAVKLLSLLHESGFLNARVPDRRQALNYKHVTFLDDPHLTQMSRWNDLQAAQWEVHPVFRTYLLGLIKERDWRKKSLIK